MNWKSLAVLIFASVLLSGCGGSSSSSAPSKIAIGFWSPPPSTIQVGGATNISAKVTNDAANGGVSWSCSPANSCGSFSPSTTYSAYSTIYSAPSSVPAGPVTITAASITESAATISSSVTVIPIPISTSFIGNGIPVLLQTSGTLLIGAQVSNDNSNSGVSWSCTPIAACGGFSQNPSPSGTLITYTAPGTAPSTGKITIIATSVSDNTSQATGTFAISGLASAASLNGKYSFFLAAPNGNRGTKSLLGSVTLDGNGNVTAGVQDLISPTVSDLQDQILPNCTLPFITSSIYQVDSSGHGRMRTCTANGQVTTYSFVLTSPSHALIIEADGSPASGSLDLQNPTSDGFRASQISGGYSFTMTGTNPVNPISKLSFGGLFTADGISSLTGGVLDVNTDGLISTTPSLTGGFTAPDSNGRGTITIPTVGRSFIYYIISPKALRLAEADGVDMMGGSAFEQAATLGPLVGSNVYQHSGWTLGGLATVGGQTVAAGQFTIGLDNKLHSAVSDSTAAASPIIPSGRVPVKVSYFFSNRQVGLLVLTDASGVSDFNSYAVDPTVNILDPNNSLAAAGGLLLLHTDVNINGTGVLIPQTVTTVLGNQVFNLTNYFDPSSSANAEFDLVGVALADGSQSLNPGLADYNRNSSNSDPILGTQFVGTFQSDTSNPGRYTGSLNVPANGAQTDYQFIPLTTIFGVAFYQVSDSQTFVVETDDFGIVSGTMQLQSLP